VTFAAPDALIELPGWQLVAGATQDEMKAWLDQRKAANHSVMWLDAAMVGDEPVFAAVAALDSRAKDWQGFVDLTRMQVTDVETITEERGLDASRYTVVSIGGFIKDNTLWGVALYRRGKSDGVAGVPTMFNAKLNLFMQPKGNVVRVVRPIPAASGELYCGLFSEGAIGAKSRYGLELSEANVVKKLQQEREAGAYPVSFVPYQTAGRDQFAVSFREDATKTPWELVRDLTASELKARADELTQKAMSPVSITVYPFGGQARYAGVWRQQPQTGAEAGSEPPSQ
jgi:hypothetical protein